MTTAFDWVAEFHPTPRSLAMVSGNGLWQWSLAKVSLQNLFLNLALKQRSAMLHQLKEQLLYVDYFELNDPFV